MLDNSGTKLIGSPKNIETIHYFVDEAGDPNLFAKRGKVIIGSDGCTKLFILGKLAVDDPISFSNDLENLRSDLLADPYFKDVPSMQAGKRKTALVFHAKDDVPEVRREVYKLLQNHTFKFYAVVRDKYELLAFVNQKNERNEGYKYNPNELYDTLTRELFKPLRPMADEIKICFAKRGNKERTKAFQEALVKAEHLFEQNFGFSRTAHVSVHCGTPRKETCLQAVDYFLWALQRFYERREERYIEMLWPFIGEIHDLDYMVDRRKGTLFNKNNPLNLKTRVL